MCSAVQNVDSTVITDYISGLQTLVREEGWVCRCSDREIHTHDFICTCIQTQLYLKSRGDLDHFTGQYFETVLSQLCSVAPFAKHHIHTNMCLKLSLLSSSSRTIRVSVMHALIATLANSSSRMLCRFQRIEQARPCPHQ